LGYCRELNSNLSGVRKRIWPTLQPKKTSASSATSAFQGFDPGFGCGSVALRFKVLILVLIAAPSRCVSRFPVLTFLFSFAKKKTCGLSPEGPEAACVSSHALQGLRDYIDRSHPRQIGNIWRCFHHN